MRLLGVFSFGGLVFLNNLGLQEFDGELYGIIEKERLRQNNGLELIPSENIVSKAVLQAMGSVLTNKYSEGYPSKRYYGGNEFIDQVESLAISRAKQLFGAEHVNVQPYSGSPANTAVYVALMAHGDPVMGMSLSQGGHLTHGHHVSFSGMNYHFSHYGVDPKTHLIDYDAVRKIALETKPKIIVSGATAYPRTIDFKRFKEICEEAGAISMADVSHIAGLIVGGVHPSPLPFTDVVTTTTHKTLRGPRGAMILCKQEYAEKIDKAVFPGLQGGPHEHTIAAKAVAFKEALQEDFKEYAKQIVANAKAMAETFSAEGVEMVSGGTDNHLLLLDLSKSGVTGKQAESALDKAGIYVNKNTVPFDKRKPFDPSGIRLGTPSITTRGFNESDCSHVASLVCKVLRNWSDENALSRVRGEVTEMCGRFPLYSKGFA